MRLISTQSYGCSSSEEFGRIPIFEQKLCGAETAHAVTAPRLLLLRQHKWQ
jgi:hypothetical protein